MNPLIFFLGILMLSSPAKAFNFSDVSSSMKSAGSTLGSVGSSLGSLASKVQQVCQGINEMVSVIDPSPYPAFQQAVQICQQLSSFGSQASNAITNVSKFLGQSNNPNANNSGSGSGANSGSGTDSGSSANSDSSSSQESQSNNASLLDREIE